MSGVLALSPDWPGAALVACCPRAQPWAPAAPPRLSSDAVRTPALACLLLPPVEHWEVLTYLFWFLAIYCRLASASGWGGGWEGRSWKPGPLISQGQHRHPLPCFWVLLAFQQVLAGVAVSSALELSVGKPDSWGPRQFRDPGDGAEVLLPAWPTLHPELVSFGSSSTVPLSQPEAWATAWDPADTAQDTRCIPSCLSLASFLGPYYLNHCI